MAEPGGRHYTPLIGITRGETPMTDGAKSIPSEFDAYSPREIARRVETAGVGKANLPTLETLTLAVLAGAFIAFGAMFYTQVVTDHGLSAGLGRTLGGIAFSLGLVLVVIAGAELFTGNNLIVMAFADRKITGRALLRNWALVYVGNFAGASATAVIVHWSGTLDAGDGAVRLTAARIAEAKMALPFGEAFFRGVLCNTLVCLAIWLSFAARSVSGKILAIVFPITAFVALGFEHSVANMYFLSIGALSGIGGADAIVQGALSNLVPVTLGNIVGGSVFVALVYWIIYRRPTGHDRQSN
jgi:formate transporter